MENIELKRYINRVKALPLLTREEEYSLAMRWRETRDQAAADSLIAANLRYVVAIAGKYRRYKLPLADLIAEGNLGMLTALEKFQPELGNRFVTYASFWIRAKVVGLILKSWSIVGTGSGALRSKMFFRLRRERARLMSQLGDTEATDQALAEKLGMTRERLGSLLERLDASDVSLDAPVFSDGVTQLGDLIPASDIPHDEAIDTENRQAALQATVRQALQALDARERYITERRLMADPEDELSLAEIGRTMGVSRERVRQLELRAKRKLEHRLRSLCEASGQSPADLMTAA